MQMLSKLEAPVSWQAQVDQNIPKQGPRGVPRLQPTPTALQPCQAEVKSRKHRCASSAEHAVIKSFHSSWRTPQCQVPPQPGSDFFYLKLLAWKKAEGVSLDWTIQNDKETVWHHWLQRPLSHKTSHCRVSPECIAVIWSLCQERGLPANAGSSLCSSSSVHMPTITPNWCTVTHLFDVGLDRPSRVHRFWPSGWVFQSLGAISELRYALLVKTLGQQLHKTSI